MITYELATERHLDEILNLQNANLKKNIDKEEILSDGFVSVVHDKTLLRAMNNPYSHTIASKDGVVIGYALSMIRSMRGQVPFLEEMIDEIENTEYKGQLLQGQPFIIMGQICVDKAYRGQGVFRGLYDHFRNTMQPNFDYIVTGISTSNKRSMRAHEKIGFDVLSIYVDEEGEWANVILNIKIRQ